MYISELIDMSIKNKKPDLVFKNANIINVFTQEIIKGDVEIHDGIVVGIGNYTGEKNIDVNNKTISIDELKKEGYINSIPKSQSQNKEFVIKIVEVEEDGKKNEELRVLCDLGNEGEVIFYPKLKNEEISNDKNEDSSLE